MSLLKFEASWDSQGSSPTLVKIEIGLSLGAILVVLQMMLG